MTLKHMFVTSGIALLAVGISSVSLADSRAEIDAGVKDSLKTFYANGASHKDLANKAAGMLIFPHITKGGAGIAGEYGEGELRVNGNTVGYYSISGGSVGLTLGAGQHSEVLMFMTPKSLHNFTESNGWTAGVDSGVAIVSEGAGGNVDTKTLQKPILGFVYGEKGIMGDLSLEGSKITRIER